MTAPEITIPEEALEAAKSAWYANQHKGTDDRMTATCLAMLTAWPEMYHYPGDPHQPANAPAIILPLTEKQDAES